MPRRCHGLFLAGLLVLMAAGAGPAAAQDVSTAILPRDIHVGDIFHAVLRVDLPAGSRAVVPDTLFASDALEPAGRVDIRSETLPGGGTRITALYPLTVWRPGESSVEPARIRVLGDGVDHYVTARFPEFEVSSVLPADTAGIEPMPARDVLGGTRIVWPWLLLGAALLLAALAFYLWRRSRPQPMAAPRAAFDPRRTALSALAEARGVELVRQGELRKLYEELADTLRFYTATLASSLGRDRTTRELEHGFGGTVVNEDDARELLAMLERADAVKFARASALPDGALADWRGARQWVERVGYAAPAVADDAANTAASHAGGGP